MKNPADLFKSFTERCPLMAIMRGVLPAEVVEIGEALYQAGFRIIEVPLNSPDPLRSITLLANHFGERMLVGAGTVLDRDEVRQAAKAGARIIVSPSTDPEVIEATVMAGLVSAPGYYTPSEAFTALKSGAHALKLFPAEAASPAMVKAQRAVIPASVPLVVVGGVSPSSMAAYLEAGANGFGLGSALYKPRQTAAQVREQANAFIEALRALS